MMILNLVVFTLLLLLMALSDYQSFYMFIDVPSIVYIASLSVISIFIIIPPRKVVGAFRVFLNKGINADRKSYFILKQVFSVWGSSALLIGLFLTVAFLVSLAQQAHEIIEPGANLSLSFSLVFTAYGLLIKIISYLISQRLYYQINNLTE